MNVIEAVCENDDLGHALCKSVTFSGHNVSPHCFHSNVRAGNWLAEYTVNRLTSNPSTEALGSALVTSRRIHTHSHDRPLPGFPLSAHVPPAAQRQAFLLHQNRVVHLPPHYFSHHAQYVHQWYPFTLHRPL